MKENKDETINLDEYYKNYKPTYGVRYGSYSKVNQRMSKFEYRILWTGLWIVFITALCFMFNSAGPLWLFILWFVGWQH